MASVMDMIRSMIGGMQGGAPMGPAPAVPSDGGMGPTIGPGAAPGQGQPLSLAPPQAAAPGAQPGYKFGLPPSGILGLLRGQTPQGILGVLQQISRQPQQGQQPGGPVMSAFQPALNPGEPRLPGSGGNYGGASM